MSAIMRMVFSLAVFFVGFVAAHEFFGYGEITLNQIYGRYTCPFGGGMDSLLLEPGGNYSHWRAERNPSADYNRGTWEIKRLQAGYSVLLNGFSHFDVDIASAKETRILLIQQNFEGVHLVTDFEQGKICIRE